MVAWASIADAMARELKVNRSDINSELDRGENILGNEEREIINFTHDSWKNKEIIVSVIVTTYGADERLFSALNSIENQEFDDEFEILISYDKGTHSGVYGIIRKWLIEEWSQKCSVSIVFHENVTLFRDRELMLDFTSGIYVSFLDYDNTYDVTKISEHVDFMKENSFLVTFSNQRDIDQNGKLIGIPHLNVPRDYKKIDELLFRNFVDSNTVFFHKSFIKNFLKPSLKILNNHFFDGVVEDYFYGLIASLTGNLNYLEKTLGNYTYHREGKTPNMMPELQQKNTEENYVKVAFYNERIYKTLVAVTLVNNKLKFSDKNLFSCYVNIIQEESLQLLPVNSGFLTNKTSLSLSVLKSFFNLYSRIQYIRKRLKARK